jgi:mRNA interferase RelE/StbE
VGQATEIYSREFDSIFLKYPLQLQERIERKIRLLGRQLAEFPHERLRGRPEYRPRAGDYRVIYGFDLRQNELYLVTVGHRRDVYR